LINAGQRQLVLEDGHLLSCDDTISCDDANAVVAGRERRESLARGPGSIAPIVRKELRDAVGSRWLIGYATLLGALGLAATATGLDAASGLALQAFGRTTATLMNLCLLLAPLVGVLMGAASIAGEQERGTLEHLLAQPLSRSRLLLAKHAGLLTALMLATVAGFVPAGVLIASATGAGMIGHYLLFPAIACLAGAAMAGIGLVISVCSRSAVQAQGTAVFTWFGFVLLYDLLLMGTLAAGNLRAEWLVAALLANPVDAARILGVLALEPDLYLLGPAGAFIATRFSPAGTAALLLAALAVWTTAPVLVATLRFRLPSQGRRRGAARRASPVLSSKEITLS
jgi:Cu-processing system permease protein